MGNSLSEIWKQYCHCSQYVLKLLKIFFLMGSSVICKVKRELGQEICKVTKNGGEVKNWLIKILFFKNMKVSHHDQLLISAQNKEKKCPKR